jgi:hypothetical protein
MRYRLQVALAFALLPAINAQQPPSTPAATSAPIPAASVPAAPAILPGNGLARHDFFFTGEAMAERMFIVRKGAVVWSYTHPAKGEISDAILLSNGDVLFAHQFGVTEITAGKKVVWNHDAPPNTEIHTAVPVGKDRVLFIQNGSPAQLVVVNKMTGKIERQFVLPVKNPEGIHLQFRQARLTDSGTVLVAHMDLEKVCEYDATGKELWSVDMPGVWSAVPLKNGNILAASRNNFVREVNRKGETVWEFSAADAPEYNFFQMQTAVRLPGGDTIISNWFNPWRSTLDPSNPPVQAVEVTPAKKIVWGLRSWLPPADLGPVSIIQVLEEPKAPENSRFGDIR